MMRLYFPYAPGRHSGGPTAFTNAFLANCRGVEFLRDHESPVDAALFLVGLNEHALRLKERGVPLVLRLDGLYHDPAVDYADLNAPIRESLALADAVVFQSKFSRRFVTNMFGPLDKPWAVIPNGVDLDVFRPGRPWDGRGEARLYYSANIHPQKRLHEALRFMAQAAEASWSLLVAGEPLHFPAALQVDLQQAYGRTVMAPQPGVRYVGLLPRDELARLAAGCHLMLHTAYRDPCPNAVVEGLACGLPVICEDTGGTPELVGDAGVVLPAAVDDLGPRDYQHSWAEILQLDLAAWKEAVTRILGDHSTFRERALARAELLDIRKTSQRYVEFISRISGKDNGQMNCMLPGGDPQTQRNDTKGTQ